MNADPALAAVPVVVFTGKHLNSDEQSELKAMAKSIVLKDVRPPDHRRQPRRRRWRPR